MKPQSSFQKIVIRMLICGVIAMVFVAALNEASYRFRKTNTDRAPEVFELVIPPGTADQIASGGDTTSIPDEMSFIVGDTLLVKNEDHVDHQMGPLWVPAGATASLAMEEKNKYAYNCSFKSTQYLGLDVLPRTTWNSRLTALGLAAPPTTMFFFVYSLITFPLDKEKTSDKKARRGNNGNGIAENKDELETNI